MTIRVAEKLSELIVFKDSTITNSNFSLEKIPFANQNEWRRVDGVISHTSNGFFHISGLRNLKTSEEYLTLYQPQSALTGLILCRQQNEVYILLQARVEPGNTGICQYGPTIQSTSANYNRLHGGKPTGYLEYFNSYHPEVKPLGFSNQLDLGKRYYLKNKNHNYVEVKSFLETSANMIWTPLKIVHEATFIDNLLNTDLKSLIAIFDWEAYLSDHSKSTSTAAKNIEAPQRSYRLQTQYELLPIDDLTHWTWGTYGVKSMRSSENSTWIDMYSVSCRGREKSHWTQPLYSCSGRGLVILAYCQTNEKKQFLINCGFEFGVTGEGVFLPTICKYPGDIGNPNFLTDYVVRQSIAQSEEGGRFYQNENLYQLVETPDKIVPPKGYKWLNIIEMKNILQSSNMVSIQLRCICALILRDLNPNVDI